MTTCLVLGGGDTLHGDLKRYTGPVDAVVACNEAGIEWAGQLDAWASLHPLFFESKGWRKARADRGHAEALSYYGYRNDRIYMPPEITQVSDLFPEQVSGGSSGLFAVKVALIDLGYRNAVLCGIPMTTTPHFWDVSRIDWRSAEGFRSQWLTIPETYRNRIRSMSGWTRVLLGEPE